MSLQKQPLWSSAVAAALARSLGISLLACRDGDPDTMLASARHARDTGDLRAGARELKQMIERDAGNSAAHLLLGELYLELGEPGAAEQHLRRALALGAEQDQTLMLLGKALLVQGNYQAVLYALPDDAAPVLRANALLGLGQHAPARALFDAALRLHADAPEALLGLARLAIAQHQPDSALALLARAIAASPGHIDCLRFQSDLLRADGKAEQALAVQHTILERRPGNPQALLDVATLHIDAGRFGDARTALAAARKLAANPVGVLYTQALLHYRAGKLSAARDAAQRVLRTAPAHRPATLLAGALELALGAYAQAEQHLQKFLHAMPGHPHATRLLLAVNVAAGQPEAALALLGPLLERADADAELLALAAEANLGARQFSAAAALFERASGLRPAPPALHADLALSRLGDGDTARALAELERTAALARNPARSGVLLVLAKLRARRPDQALAVLAMLEKTGVNPLTLHLKGRIYLACHDLRQARASMHAALAHDPAFLPALASLAQLDLAAQRAGDTRKRYLAALHAAPGNSALMEALAALATSRHQHRDAIAWMARACDAQPANLALALRAGALYLSAGAPARALQFARQLQAAHPASADVLTLLGQALAATGQFGAAAECFARLATLAPASGAPHLHMARVLLAQQQDAAAVAALSRALALEPDLIAARSALVALLTCNGRYSEALALAAACQKRHPQAADGFRLEGDVHAAQHKHGAACAAYRRAFALAPDGALLVLLHGALAALGRTAEADAVLTHWLRKHPADIAARLHCAASKLAADDARGAIVHLEHVLRHAPDNVAVLNDLAWCCHRVGERRALALAQRAHALAPDQAGVMDTLGWIYLEQGESARALPLLQKAAALAPLAGEIRYHYAHVLLAQGERRAARHELQQALAAPSRFARRDEARALLATL